MRDVLDEAIGVSPPTRIDIDTVIIRHRRLARLRLASAVVAVVAVAVVVSGAVVVTQRPEVTGSPSDTPTFDAARDRADQLAQAQAALDRWAAATRNGPVLNLTGPQTGQIGDWEDNLAGYQESLHTGTVLVTTQLPSDTPPPGEIRWDDGRRRTVELVSAAAAVDEFLQKNEQIKDGSGVCPTCTPIEVTGAMLTTTTLSTSSGPALVPIWAFTVKGSAVRIWRVAVADTSPPPGPHDPNRPPAGLSADRATLKGQTLTVYFIGAPRPASERCGTDYSAEVITSDVAVVVLIHERHYQPPAEEADTYRCSLAGFPREATVELAAPLDGRVVLEVRYGKAIPVTIG